MHLNEKEMTMIEYKQYRLFQFSLSQIVLCITCLCIGVAFLVWPVRTVTMKQPSGNVCKATIYRQFSVDRDLLPIEVGYEISVHLNGVEVERFKSEAEDMVPSTFVFQREDRRGTIWYGYRQQCRENGSFMNFIRTSKPNSEH